MVSFCNMHDAIMAWAKPTTVFVVAKRQVDFKTVESYFEKRVNLFRVPTGQNLDMNKEGQRRWRNVTIYTDNSLDLRVDDIIFFDCSTGERFRVMSKMDWSEYGFIEYDLTSDYSKGAK